MKDLDIEEYVLQGAVPKNLPDVMGATHKYSLNQN